jgi:deoxyribonuclease-4
MTTTPNSLLLGAHNSIAGGLYTAFERGMKIGCTTMQIWTTSNRQWRQTALKKKDVAQYKLYQEKSQIQPVIVHSSYLINLGSPNKTVLKKSRRAFKGELERCRRLGIHYLNFHPGAHLGTGEEDGIKRIAESLNIVHEQTTSIAVMSVLETTAGQGSNVGYRFEQLRSIIDLVEDKKRMGVCVDTCHIFAAGYDIRTERGWEKTFQEFDDILGFERLVCVHVNDSVKGLGSRVDRHKHIGKGKIGNTAFRLLMNDKRFEHIPKILETPKGEDLREDVINLRKLRRFVVSARD